MDQRRTVQLARRRRSPDRRRLHQPRRALCHTFGATLVRDGHDLVLVLVLVAELVGRARLDQTRR
jgi:hypothetical protein